MTGRIVATRVSGIRARAKHRAAGLLAGAIVLMATAAAAIDVIHLETGPIRGDQWTVDGLRVSLRLDGAEGVPSARVDLEMPSFLAGQPGARTVSLDCGRLEIDGVRMSCLQARIAGQPVIPILQGQALDLTFDRSKGVLEVVADALRLAGADGNGRLKWDLADGLWQSKVALNNVDPGRVRELLDGFDAELAKQVAEIGFDAGRLSLRGEASGGDGRPTRLTLSAQATGWALNNADGTLASEGLKARLELDLRCHGGECHGPVRLNFNAGQLFADPLFLDFDTAPLSLDARLGLHSAAHPMAWTLSEVKVDQSGVLNVGGELGWGRNGQGLSALRVDRFDLRLPVGFQNWVSPFLLDQGLDDLETTGRVEGHLSWEGGKLVSLGVRFDEVFLEDADQRFALYGMNGSLGFDRRQPVDSVLAWSGGSVGAINLGAARVQAHTAGGVMELIEATELPLLDGALVVEDFVLHGLDGTGPASWRFNGLLKPISLEALSTALQWPVMEGRFSGVIPTVRYSAGVIETEGVLLAQVFDGVVRIRELRMEDPFGVVPRVRSEVELEGLDMEQLTQTFDFGTISGTLDGYIRALELQNWRPARFDAGFRTRDDDSRDHRLSRRALADLTSVAGGPGGIASGGILGIFDSFAYDAIGVNCRLADGVCDMSGLGAKRGGGYYLMRGAGLPKVDVVGFARKVDWDVLINRLTEVRLDSLRIE
ncbi:MAG: hypothetical protein ACPGU7_06715 [Gammaproteobacteria bacterium]